MRDDMNGKVFGHNAPAAGEPAAGRPRRTIGSAEQRLRDKNARSWWSGPATLFAWIRGARPPATKSGESSEPLPPADPR